MDKDEVVGLLVELIRIPSFVTDEPGVDENNLVDFIEDWLEKNTKLKVERQGLPGGRFNLIAKQGEPETVFLGHTDTVQPSKDAPVNQLTGEIIKDEIWGRGATDMKSGVAALMSAANLARNANNYWIIFYADEEYDFLGMKSLVGEFGKLKPKRIISADGSDLAVGHGCRGLIELTCRIKGETGHPAKGTGKNAIWGTMAALSNLKKYLARFRHPIMGGTSFNLAYIQGGTELTTSMGSNNRLREVGKAGNVVPDICEFTIDIRPAKPDLNADEVVKFLEKEFKDLGLGFELAERKHDLGAWYTDREELQSFSRIAKETVGRSNFADPRSTGYLDLQMLWEATERPTAFMFGGGIGSTAHKPDERIKISDLVKTRDFFLKVMEGLD
ncbi:MAG TPA: M20/M25/M40 family metallo-hydrolase [Patescibacteria group bacterium]|nr:M20/M25/M40 family metallo-hydrolase [Patescibacteria group bacterium]